MKSSRLLSIVCLVLSAGFIQAARIKIHLERESVEKYREHVFKRLATDGGSACDDKKSVERSSLVLPGRLNDLNSRVTFYRSPTATRNLKLFQNMSVPLDNFRSTTVGEVLKVLGNSTCLPFFYGGAVRDQFLNECPKDADVEIDCSIEVFYDRCVATWGVPNCHKNSMTMIGHVGIPDTVPDNIDVASTTITFYAPISKLEYTVNALAYDLNGNDVIIDLTGTGLMDACNCHIRIPSDDDSLESWTRWLSDTSGSAVFRFWKLRSKGLTAYNSATLQFITSQIMMMIGSDPNYFGTSYCKNVYGKNYDNSSRTCTTTANVCADNSAIAMKYDAALAQDFGGYWINEIQPKLLPTCGPGSGSGSGSGSGTGGVPPLSFSLKFMFGLLLIALLGF